MFTKDDVTRLVDGLGDTKFEPAPVIETGQFGLSAHLFDPVSGQIITLAQPHRTDVGQPEILLTPKQASQAVASARAQHLLSVRAAGHVSIEAYNEHQKQVAASRDLSHKQAIERAKLDEDHAVATAAAAPKPYREDASRGESSVDMHPNNPNTGLAGVSAQQKLADQRAYQDDASRRETSVVMHPNDSGLADVNRTLPPDQQAVYQEDASRRESVV